LTKVNSVYCLRKSEIIRGYNSFKKVLVNSKVLTNRFLRLNIQYKKEITENKEIQILKDPLTNVKVGFVVSKRFVRKASMRNRLRRLAREAYRLNKNILIDNTTDYEIILLFGYNEDYKDELRNLDIEIVKENMKILIEKVLIYLKKQK
jgi:ribonuclease P protein component